MLGQIENPLDSLKNGIIQEILMDDEGNIWIPLNKIQELWSSSEFNKQYNRRLTDAECLYIAQQIRIHFEIDKVNDDWLFSQIKNTIGEKKNSIFGFINIGLIGIFAYIGYKIINRKR